MKKLFYCALSALFLLSYTQLSASEQGSATIPTEKKKGKKRKRANIERILASLPSEEKQRLQELRKTDRKAFQQELRKLVKKYRKRESKYAAETRRLLKEYNRASTEEEKSKITAQLKVLVKKEFDDRMSNNAKNIQRLEKRLELLKERIKKTEENSAAIIEKRIKQLLKKGSK